MTDAPPRVSIIVPTFNERANVQPLLSQIEDAMTSQPYDYEVIVVDDDSPDETWKVAESFVDSHPVTVIRRRSDPGLAKAVVEGFSRATGEYLVVMDADLQHPPERIPDLVAGLEGGADIAIGSRSIEGGSYGEFSLRRRVLSSGANVLAKSLLPSLRPISDLQSGFFAVGSSLIHPEGLDPIGYKVLLEVLVKEDIATHVEIGYRFRDRSDGTSNLGVDSIVDFLRHILLLSRSEGRSSNS